jgi:hypothetical protein
MRAVNVSWHMVVQSNQTLGFRAIWLVREGNLLVLIEVLVKFICVSLRRLDRGGSILLPLRLPEDFSCATTGKV